MAGMDYTRTGGKPYRDTYMAVLALRSLLSGYWADDRLTAPEGVDVDEVMRQVDRHLFAAEELLRPETGNVETPPPAHDNGHPLTNEEVADAP